MARRVSDWRGLTFQTGREYSLVFGRVGWTGSTLPFAVPNQQAFAETIAAVPGMTLQSVNRPAFSENMVAKVIYTGPGLETPGQLIPLPLHLEADLAGSVEMELEEVVVRSRASDQETEQARRREGDVVSSPSGQLDILSAVPWPALVLAAAVAFAFTGAGQGIIDQLTGGGGG